MKLNDSSIAFVFKDSAMGEVVQNYITQEYPDEPMTQELRRRIVFDLTNILMESYSQIIDDGEPLETLRESDDIYDNLIVLLEITVRQAFPTMVPMMYIPFDLDGSVMCILHSDPAPYFHNH